MLILLFPAIVIPYLVGQFREPAFRSIEEIDVAQVESIELFILNRPDGGVDIGGTRKLHAVAPENFDKTLEVLRHATPVAAASGRGIWLGRVVVTLKNGRTQTVMLHRPTHEYDATKPQRIEMRIGSHQFEGLEVDEFTKRLGEIAGVEPPPERPAK